MLAPAHPTSSAAINQQNAIASNVECSRLRGVAATTKIRLLVWRFKLFHLVRFECGERVWADRRNKPDAEYRNGYSVAFTTQRSVDRNHDPICIVPWRA